MKRIVNAVLVLLGFVSMAIGIVGIVLPVLPTVPFFIGAALLFAKGSERFSKWFTSTKMYQNNLGTLVERRAMTLKKKWKIVLMVTALMVLAGIMMPKWWLRLMLAVILAIHYYIFFGRIETMTEEEEARLQEIIRQKQQKAEEREDADTDR